MNRSTKISAAVAGICSLLGAGIAFANRRAAGTGADRCQLTLPHSSIDPLVFPDKTGSEALDAAIVGNADEGAIRRVISEQGGLRVAHGTPCSRIESGANYSRVLVIGGPLDGKQVWAPTLHTRGQ